METDWLSSIIESIIESIISSLKVFQRNFQTLSMVGFAAVLIATWEVRISNLFVFRTYQMNCTYGSSICFRMRLPNTF